MPSVIQQRKKRRGRKRWRRVWRRRNGTEEAAERCGRGGRKNSLGEGRQGRPGRTGRRDREGHGSRVVRHSPDLRPYPLPALLETPYRPLPVVPRTRFYFVFDSASGLAVYPRCRLAFLPKNSYRCFQSVCPMIST